MIFKSSILDIFKFIFKVWALFFIMGVIILITIFIAGNSRQEKYENAQYKYNLNHHVENTMIDIYHTKPL